MAPRVGWRSREEWALFEIRDKSSGVSECTTSHWLVFQNECRTETRRFVLLNT
jgi:hypothetical protein